MEVPAKGKTRIDSMRRNDNYLLFVLGLIALAIVLDNLALIVGTVLAIASIVAIVGVVVVLLYLLFRR
ncbi:MAG: hypothetical protein OXL97_07070 [Chloroflexota bacterium]|nr:hypothetical protein [Chloroflexota bacterium]MDE2885393.1 hypothetical protein [Chloroflexota bacterium]